MDLCNHLRPHHRGIGERRHLTTCILMDGLRLLLTAKTPMVNLLDTIQLVKVNFLLLMHRTEGPKVDYNQAAEVPPPLINKVVVVNIISDMALGS